MTLKEWLELHRLSIAFLAREFGASPQTVGKWVMIDRITRTRAAVRLAQLCAVWPGLDLEDLRRIFCRLEVVPKLDATPTLPPVELVSVTPTEELRQPIEPAKTNSAPRKRGRPRKMPALLEHARA